LKKIPRKCLNEGGADNKIRNRVELKGNLPPAYDKVVHRVEGKRSTDLSLRFIVPHRV
jgi:hypothetical protein